MEFIQIDGTLLAPPKVGSWQESSLFQWINFKWIQNFTIQGNGIVDGQGSEWWTTTSQIYYAQVRHSLPYFHLFLWTNKLKILIKQYLNSIAISFFAEEIHTDSTYKTNRKILILIYHFSVKCSNISFNNMYIITIVVLLSYMQAIRFYASNNLTVRDIRIINTPQCHLKFDSSSDIQVDNIKISSPENSPNTDGIHLQNTQNVEIRHSSIACGNKAAE